MISDFAELGNDALFRLEHYHLQLIDDQADPWHGPCFIRIDALDSPFLCSVECRHVGVL